MVIDDRPEVLVADWGACTALGNSWESTSNELLSGSTAPEYQTLHDVPSCFAINNEIETETDHPRFHEIALTALRDLGTKKINRIDEPIGIVAATSKGGLGNGAPSCVTGLANPGIWTTEISSRFDRVEQTASTNTACATGLTALIHAARWIVDEEVSHAMVLASESCFYPLMLSAYNNLGVLCSEQGMRPFHPDRDGFALGEAAAAVWLTDRSMRDKHELTPKASVEGWGESCDAHHMTQMDKKGGALRTAIEQSLLRSDIDSDELDVIHAHLTTTEANDQLEEKLIKEFPESVVLQGIKPALGHTIGAAGLLELIATIQTLQDGDCFPIPNTSPDRLPRAVKGLNQNSVPYPRHGVSWNMGFGGHNACVTTKVNESVIERT